MPISAYAVAKFPDPEVNLSAFGALLIAICFFFESPMWSLLGSSAALVRTKEDFRILHHFLNILCAALAAIYLLLVVSPLANFIVIPLFGATQDLYALALPSFVVGAVWPFLIGYRRVNQGVLIHVGKSKLVSLTSISRIVTLVMSVSGAYIWQPNLAGLTIISVCSTLALLTDAGFSHIFVLKYGIPRLTEEKSELTVRATWDFCSPTILASVVSQLMMPLGSAVLFRLPESRLSLIVWPAITGLLQLIRTAGLSLIELTASCGDNPKNRATILKFSNRISIFLLVFLLVFVFSGIAENYFSIFAGLEKEYAKFASATLAYAIFYPAIEPRLWYLTGVSYALKKTNLVAKATFVAVGLGFALYFIGLNQSFLSGAAFLLVLFTICTLAETAVLYSGDCRQTSRHFV